MRPIIFRQYVHCVSQPVNVIDFARCFFWKSEKMSFSSTGKKHQKYLQWGDQWFHSKWATLRNDDFRRRMNFWLSLKRSHRTSLWDAKYHWISVGVEFLHIPIERKNQRFNLFQCRCKWYFQHSRYFHSFTIFDINEGVFLSFLLFGQKSIAPELRNRAANSHCHNDDTRC